VLIKRLINDRGHGNDYQLAGWAIQYAGTGNAWLGVVWLFF